MPKIIPLLDRFVSKIQPELRLRIVQKANGAPVPMVDYCWNWTATIFEKRGEGNLYGMFWYNRKFHSAHKLAFQWAGGVITPGYEIHHVCENKKCVNPEHLRCVTRLQNVRESQYHLLVTVKNKKSSLPRNISFSGRRKKPYALTVKIAEPVQERIFMRFQTLEQALKVRNFLRKVHGLPAVAD